MTYPYHQPGGYFPGQAEQDAVANAHRGAEVLGEQLSSERLWEAQQRGGQLAAQEEAARQAGEAAYAQSRHQQMMYARPASSGPAPAVAGTPTSALSPTPATRSAPPPRRPAVYVPPPSEPSYGWIVGLVVLVIVIGGVFALTRSGSHHSASTAQPTVAAAQPPVVVPPDLTAPNGKTAVTGSFTATSGSISDENSPETLAVGLSHVSGDELVVPYMQTVTADNGTTLTDDDALAPWATLTVRYHGGSYVQQPTDEVVTASSDTRRLGELHFAYILPGSYDLNVEGTSTSGDVAVGTSRMKVLGVSRDSDTFIVIRSATLRGGKLIISVAVAYNRQDGLNVMGGLTLVDASGNELSGPVHLLNSMSSSNDGYGLGTVTYRGSSVHIEVGPSNEEVLRVGR